MTSVHELGENVKEAGLRTRPLPPFLAGQVAALIEELFSESPDDFDDSDYEGIPEEAIPEQMRGNPDVMMMFARLHGSALQWATDEADPPTGNSLHIQVFFTLLFAPPPRVTTCHFSCMLYSLRSARKDSCSGRR